MKKILSLALALAMVLCMGTAFATEDTSAPAEKVTKENFLAKSWTGEEVNPSEALYFDVTNAVAGDGAESEVTKETIALEMAEGGNAFTLTHDKLEPGVYTFTVNEHNNGTAGVTYDSTVYVIDIFATYVVDKTTKVPTEEIEYNYAVSTAEGKLGEDDSIVNTYADGAVTVKKVVTGNLANKNDTFTVTVTFTSDKLVNMPITVNGTELPASAWTAEGDGYKATATLTVKAADTNGYAITGIPAGVKVSVEEADPAPYTLVKYEGNDVVITDDAEAVITITNEYTTEIKTGINMDSMPYIVLMGLVVLAGVALILKKRTAND